MRRRSLRDGVAPRRAIQPRPSAAPRHGCRAARRPPSLLVALGAEQRRRGLQAPPEDEIEALSLEMAQLATVPPDADRAVCDELVETAMAADFDAEGGVDFAREVLERVLGAERAGEIIGRLVGDASRCGRSSSCAARRRTRSATFLQTSRRRRSRSCIANLHTTLGRRRCSRSSRPSSRPTSPLRIAHDERDLARRSSRTSRPCCGRSSRT